MWSSACLPRSCLTPISAVKNFDVRASSYEPGGTNCVFISEISARSTGINSRNTTKMVEDKLVLFGTVIALWTPCNFTNKAKLHTGTKWKYIPRPKCCHFGRYVVRAKLFCLKCFIPVIGLECSYMGKVFIPVIEISIVRTEISVTGPARPLI